MEQLKKCPFCGGEAEVKYAYSFGFTRNYEAECMKCFCTVGVYLTEAEAITAWNTRKPMERIMERLEEKAKEPMYQHDGEDYFVGIVSAIEIVKGEM